MQANEVIFERVPASTGLKSDYVLCLGQSTDGFIWVGTQSGLQRYDGYRMVSYYGKDTKERIPARPVEQLLQADQADLMWIRTGNSVGLFNTKDFSYQKIAINGNGENGVTLYSGYAGKTYLILKGNKILSYNPAKRAFQADPSLQAIPSDFGPSTMHVLANGDFYLGGKKGLGFFSQRNKAFYTAQYNPLQDRILTAASKLKWIRLLLLDHQGRFFLESWPPRSGQELFLVSKGSSVAKKLTLSPMIRGSYYGLNALSEYNGVVWALGGGIFNIFEGSGFEHFYDPKNSVYGISSSIIFQLFSDRDRNLWVATNNGLYMASVVGNYMRNASTGALFGPHDQTSVLQTSPGRFLMGSWGGGVQGFSYTKENVIFNDKSIGRAIYARVPADGNYKMVWDMALDHSGQIWFGCQHGRLVRYDQARRRSTFSTPAVFAQQTIRQVVVDERNAVWMGTQGGKLVRFYQGTFKEMADFKVIISKLLLTADGDLWIGTSGKGVIRYSLKKNMVVGSYVKKKARATISSNQISDIAQLNDTLLAVACDANMDLIHTSSGKIVNFSPYNGLEQNIISSLTTDHNGHLWMASNGGVVRFDPKKDRFRSYGQKDGMVNTSAQDNQMYISQKFSGGKLLFAGAKNFMIFDPDSLNRKFIPKQVVITGFRLFDTYLPPASYSGKGAIKLKSGQNVFSLQFSSLSYRQTSQLSYFYRLKGASDQWIRVENGQSASFASLAPGKYTFMVYAVNPESIRSVKTTMLDIEIIPEFYQTWYFSILVALLCLLPIFIIYRLREKRTREVYRLREKVARDLHDDVGSTLTAINMLSEVAQRGLGAGQEESLKHIRKIGQNSAQMMESMDDIVWSIKPDNDRLSKITVRLREYTTQILEPQDIAFEFNADEQMPTVTLSMDSRRHLFMIYKEALNNITKYASATHVGIELAHRSRIIVLSIQDNGKGFDMGRAVGGNGLANMSERAQLMGGALEISSAAGKGTRIILRIPV